MANTVKTVSAPNLEKIVREGFFLFLELFPARTG